MVLPSHTNRQGGKLTIGPASQSHPFPLPSVQSPPGTTPLCQTAQSTMIDISPLPSRRGTEVAGRETAVGRPTRQARPTARQIPVLFLPQKRFRLPFPRPRLGSRRRIREGGVFHLRLLGGQGEMISLYLRMIVFRCWVGQEWRW